MTRITLLAGALAMTGCTGPSSPVEARQWSVIGGDVADDDTVVLITQTMGWLEGGYNCSGTVIGPREVLTAKHCLPDSGSPAELRVHPSLHGDGPELHVVELHTTAGETFYDQDVAVLVVDRDLGIAPRVLRSDLSELEPGDPLTVVGYGRRDNGDSGTRYWGRTAFDSFGPRPLDDYYVDSHELVIDGEAGTCFGDSGGPVLDEQGRVIGVISWRTDEDCSAHYSVATAIDFYLDVPRAAMGYDAPCDFDDDCREGTCLALPEIGDRICTLECDPLRPMAGCQSGSYCRSDGAGSPVCAPGIPRGGQLWDACSSDVECAGGFCRQGQCRTPCLVDADCGYESHCEPSDAGVAGACFANGPESSAPTWEDRPADEAGPVPATDEAPAHEPSGGCQALPGAPAAPTLLLPWLLALRRRRG